MDETIQGVLPNTARHAGCVKARHIIRPYLGTILTVLRLEVAFWAFAKNRVGSPHSQVDKFQSVRAKPGSQYDAGYLRNVRNMRSGASGHYGGGEYLVVCILPTGPSEFFLEPLWT